jgi:hypothetical protein
LPTSPLSDVHVVTLDLSAETNARRQVRLLKVGLLYADRVTVATPMGYLEDDDPADRNFEQFQTAIFTDVVSLNYLNRSDALLDPARGSLFEHASDRGMAEGIRRLFADPSAYPLLTDPRRVLRRLLADEAVPDASFLGARHIRLAGELIADLEAFPNADIDVVLDVRDRLERPLASFRSAVSEFSGELKEMPGTPAFAAEVRALFLRRVQPEINALHESIHSMGAREALMRGLPPAAGGVVGLTMAVAFQMPDLVNIAGAALAGALLTLVGTELKHHADERKLRDRNRLFWLYEADTALRGAS